MTCAETAETDRFAVLVVDSGGLKEAQVQSYLPGCTNLPSHMAHWRHLANTIEPSVCGSNAVLCQITLTTCYHYFIRPHHS